MSPARQATVNDHDSPRPYRTLGIRVFNAVSRALGRLGLPGASLDEESLLAAARRLTGLQEFGDESFREPLGVLLRAYNEESELNPAGRWLVRISTLTLLCNRLRVHDQLSQHPDILDTPVRRPLFVAGLPRTGTTLLYNLLAQDPAARPLLMWEAVFPAERKRKPTAADSRLRITKTITRTLTHLAPQLPAVHPIEPEGPEECSRLLMNTFVTSYALMENYVPSYYRWLASQPEEVFDRAYRDYYQQLQLLQWQRPPRGHWVLKSPAHLFALGSLMRTFPDAAIVQIHRDPHKVVPSLCSLFAVYQGITSDRVRSRMLGPEILELCVEELRRGSLACQSVAPGRVLNLRYAELVADPAAAVRNVYEHFNYPLPDDFDRRAVAWVQHNPKDKHGKHVYDLAQFGLTPAMIDEALETYCREYQIEPEGRRPAAAQA
jgi:hypothetical protein